MMEDKNISHWVQLAIHLAPLVLAGYVLIKHLIVFVKNKERNTKELTEETNRSVAITLLLLASLVVSVLVETFSSLSSMQNNAETARENTTKILEHIQTRELEGEQVSLGTDGIYQIVEEKFRERRNSDDNLQIDILGYTLYSVAPKLSDWKKLNYLHNLTINLFHLDENFARNSSSINPMWPDQVRTRVNEIKSFIETNKDYLKDNRIEINLCAYSRIPGVHGFRFGDDTYFISFASWELDGKYIKLPTEDEFLRLPKTNGSKQANALRKLFDNWVNSNRRTCNKDEK